MPEGPELQPVTDDLRGRVLRAMAATSPTADGDDAVSALDRVCRSLTAELRAEGAAVNLMSDRMGSQAVVGSSSPWSARVDELQFVLGEGPCHDAFASRRPVLAVDLDADPRWPAYALAAEEAGVEAVFAFPLQVGAVGLGVLDVYVARRRSLTDDELALALEFAEVATETLVDSTGPGQGRTLDPSLTSAMGSRARVYQAQGALMITLGVPLVEALVRMRAHAFAHHLDLDDVAAAVLDGTLDLSQDL